MRCKLQPELHCADCTKTSMHMLTWHMQPIVHSWPKASAMDATAVPHTNLIISLYLLGPTVNADPPTSPQMRPFPLKREAEKFMPSAMCCCPSFFPLPQESSKVSNNQTQGSSNSTNSSQSMSSKAFWTPNTALSQFVELPEPGSRGKVLPNEEWTKFAELFFIIFFRFAELPELGSRSKSSLS